MSFLDQLPPDLREKIEIISTSNPSAIDVFQELYNYINIDPENRKKPKNSGLAPEVTEDSIIFQLRDVSVLTPFRKKLNLVISLSPISGKPTLSLSKDMVPQLTISELNKSVKFATFLPFPEKKNAVYLFMSYTSALDPNANEYLLVTLNKEATLTQLRSSGLIPNDANDISPCIDYIRKQAILVGFRVADPFSASNVGPVPFHVEAHRGTKEGTLYFLPDHVLFGFKKPILLFSSQEIESITYSSITRLTFNVTLITKNGDKYEFSMIDQNEYALIDDYVKRKQVVDNSMSEENKAKTAHKDQNAAEHSSLLAEAAQQLESGGKISNIPLESDDEEADNDFEGDSNLSDGSDIGSSEDEEEEDGDEEEDAAEEEAAEENVETALNEQDQNFSNEVDEQQFELLGKVHNTFGADDFDDLTQGISFPMETDGVEDEDDSGVEYD
ncbi:LAME_0F16138g1_1 [Lachancea meyersii CBS 8951]|uniref:Histone chaperone RTT106 n=1 Tax=Lachancea meyersii CBS 8951 TaxID=1266667 RepID=A0A1G4JYZ0_9SACH|nr:LAME_0F16138g1_1 [Lachancea meyersii CBS 8951]